VRCIEFEGFEGLGGLKCVHFQAFAKDRILVAK
jgi:hypothetical protein